MLQKVKLNYGTVAVYCIMIFLCLKHTCVLIPFASSEASASELQQLLSCRQVSWPIGWVDFDLFRRFFTNWQWGWSFVKIKKGIKRKTTRRTCHTKFNFNRKMQSTQHSVDLIWNPENVRTIFRSYWNGCTVRKYNCWRYCVAQCDEIFDHFPLFDETLRHIRALQ